MKELHKYYGKFVRTAPKEVNVSDAAAIEKYLQFGHQLPEKPVVQSMARLWKIRLLCAI